MDNKRNSKLTKWIVILPLIGIVITAFVLIDIFVRYEKEVYSENLFDIKREVVKKSKISARDKVIEVINHIKISEKLLREESQREIRTMVNFAISVMDYDYNENKNLPKKEIRKNIIEKLRNIRFFDNKSGYFFIYDMQGNSLLLPHSPSLENTNLFDLRDAKGTYTIREHIKIIKEKTEGFHEWYWYKPGSQLMKKKIGFVKEYKNLGIYIGTARYEEDIQAEIKKEIQVPLVDIRYGEKGYIFAYDYGGNTISHIDKKLIGTNMWDFILGDVHVVRNIIEGAMIIKDGFFMTYFSGYDEETGDKKYKTSFIKEIPSLGWVIGTGAFYKDVVHEIDLKQIVLEKKLSFVVQKVGYTILFFLIVMLIVTLIISIKLSKVLKTYQDNLVVKHNQTIVQKEQLVYQLEHDYLTSLPNRIMLMDRLNRAINLSKRDKREIAIMFIDIDNFKTINDSMGHDVGDIILKEVAVRLQNTIRESDTIARFGGDEFIILVENYQSIHDIIVIINNIKRTIKKPIVFEEREYNTTLSMGISVFPNDGDTPQSLLKNADIAMYMAKDSGKDTYKFFTNEMNEEIQTRISIENDLLVACEKNQFILHYQPIVDVRTNKIVSVEGLIRWEHPTEGLIYPDQFISIAEDSNIIIDIGNWVIDESMKKIVEWKSKGYSVEKISVNIASRQLENNNLIDYIEEALKRNSCKAKWVEIEVIERYVMKDPEKSVTILRRLKNMGIDIAIDDFGTGYSSLAYLKHLPVAKLKIDREFVKNLDNNFEDRAIAQTIIALGNGLLMDVLAEGVETDKQKQFLKENGCNLMQGHFFSKPIISAELEPLLKKEKL